MKKRLTNIPASVHARLLNRARAEERPFNELLLYYAMERFLYRLYRSEHARSFVLKGALMLQFWGGPAGRSTKDIDLMGRQSATVDELVEVLRDCLAGEEIRIDAKYDGVRLRFLAFLGNARIVLQVDVGFGDVITPGPQQIEYPSLLDFSGPRLLGYTPESTVAEKLQAMVVLDMANTRMKDFFDIWVLARSREFSGPLLARAIRATFARRATPLPAETPVALTPAFHSSPVKQAQWRAYLRKGHLQGRAAGLVEVVELIGAFLLPVMEALSVGEAFDRHWPSGGSWQGREEDSSR